MKAIFYKEILNIQGLTPTDKIVYCQILYLSIMDKDNRYAFDSDGKFTLDVFNDDFGGLVPITWRVNDKTVMDVLHINRRQYYLSRQHLKEEGYIKTLNGEKVIKLIKLVPYFNLYVDSGLCGKELIVYSYIKNKNSKYGDLDKYHDALAKEIGISFWSLEKILSVLYKKKFLEGINKGKRKLLRAL